MITLKLKYCCDETTSQIIDKLRRQYSSVYRTSFIFICNNPNLSKFEIEKKYSPLSIKLDSLNNVDMIDFIYKQSAIDEAYATVHTNYNENKAKTIFGGKKNFHNRRKNLITREEYLEKRLSPLYCIGRANLTGGNQKFKLQEDLKSIKFGKSMLYLTNVKNRHSLLSKLYSATLEHRLPVSYKLTKDFVYVTFDEKKLYENEIKLIKNRIMAIDMNPNYVGWSIVDWKSSSSFNIVKTGIISIKTLNDIENELSGYSSTSKERKWISNKRKHETIEAAKHLVRIALHYKCNIFSLEELNIKSEDKGNRRFNKLCNNMWCRNSLVGNISKLCNIKGIKLQFVKPEYSSFIGNFLFRSLNYPDMILASIEIGRRSYEYYNQYVTKQNKIQKNIVQPNILDFKCYYVKSLEEFGITEENLSLIELYYLFKKSKLLYRLSVDKFDLQFSRLKSIKSKLYFISF